MVSNNEKPISSEELDLEPLGEDCNELASDNKPEFKVDTRGDTARRQTTDRREEIRFQSDRRKGKGRRKDDNVWGSDN